MGDVRQSAFDGRAEYLRSERVNGRKFNGDGVLKGLTSREASRCIDEVGVHGDGGGVVFTRVLLGHAVADHTVPCEGLAQLHHFGVENDGLLTLLAVSSKDAGIVAIIFAWGPSVNLLVQHVAARGRPCHVKVHHEGNPLIFLGVRIAVEVIRIVDITSDGDRGRTGGAQRAVDGVPFQAGFGGGLGVRAIQVDALGCGEGAVQPVLERGQSPVGRPIHELDDLEDGGGGGGDVDDGGSGGHGMPVIRRHDGGVVPFAGEPIRDDLVPGRRSVVVHESRQRRLVEAGHLGVLEVGIGRAGQEVTHTRHLDHMAAHVVIGCPCWREGVRGMGPVGRDEGLPRCRNVDFHEQADPGFRKVDAQGAAQPAAEDELAATFDSVQQNQSVLRPGGIGAVFDFHDVARESGHGVKGHEEGSDGRGIGVGQGGAQDEGLGRTHRDDVRRLPSSGVLVGPMPIEVSIGLESDHLDSLLIQFRGRSDQGVVGPVFDFSDAGVLIVWPCNHHVVVLGMDEGSGKEKEGRQKRVAPALGRRQCPDHNRFKCLVLREFRENRLITGNNTAEGVINGTHGAIQLCGKG